MDFRFTRAERKARAEERAERRRQFRQTPGDLLRQVLGLATSALIWGYAAFAWWSDTLWVAIPLLVLGVIPFLLLLGIVGQLLRGKHQVQIQERAICNACEAVVLPRHMRFHQFQGEKCEGAGWVTTPRHDGSESPRIGPSAVDVVSPLARGGLSQGPGGERGKIQVGWVIGAAVTLALVVGLAGSYGWVTLAAGEPTADEPTGQAAEAGFDTPGVDPSDLRVGQCVKDVPSGSDEHAPESVEVVDCSEPHAEEVYGRFRIPSPTYPGDRRTEALAWRTCDKLFEKYVGTPPDDSRLEPFITFPSKETWVDSHAVVCTVAGAGDAVTTGSVRNTGS